MPPKSKSKPKADAKVSGAGKSKAATTATPGASPFVGREIIVDLSGGATVEGECTGRDDDFLRVRTRAGAGHETWINLRSVLAISVLAEPAPADGSPASLEAALAPHEAKYGRITVERAGGLQGAS